MALTDRTPLRIARRFWHGWTRSLPAHILLGALFTLTFLPIATVPLTTPQGDVHTAVFASIGLSLWTVVLSWAVSGFSMREGFALGQIVLALPRLVVRSLVAALLFVLFVGGPFLGLAVPAGGIGLAIGAGLLAFGFFLFLDWNGHTTAPRPAPAMHARVSFPAALVHALWGDVRRLVGYVRGVWRRVPAAMFAMVAGLFALSLVLMPLTWLAGLVWPHAPLWAGLFFAFVLFSSMPSLAAAAMVDAHPVATPKVA